MPLDARKIQHIVQVITRSFASRQRTVVIVYLASGSYTYAGVQVIMRSLHVVNPQIVDGSGHALPLNADTLLIAPLGTSFTGAVFVADTTSATSGAVAAASKYEIVEVLPVGIVPGGSHLRVALRRIR
ncbi:MAG: hypothetical protein H0V70_10320 [Ktedonobacteraceae bacterium]|nr:hypothetical protein [Ktedonobacteraceae bacterium]